MAEAPDAGRGHKDGRMIYEEDDICGLCGLPGADKYHQPVYWPTEERPGTKLVHVECERAECKRAFEQYRNAVGEEGIKEFLRGL